MTRLLDTQAGKLYQLPDHFSKCKANRFGEGAHLESEEQRAIILIYPCSTK